MVRRFAVLLALASSSLPLAAQEAAPAAPRPFARVVEHDDGNRLELLAATYAKGDATLTLFSAVHLADAGCYAELQRRFLACDVLLYELVADADTRPYPGRPDAPHELDALAAGYRIAARALRCVCQTDAIDYRPRTFVHADLTPAQLDAAFARAGTSLLGELVRTAQSGDDEPLPAVDFVAAWRAGHGVRTLRQTLARVLVRGGLTAAASPVVIEARNERCLEVLAQQLTAGKKRLGIFYGAAHMPHLEQRLLRDLGWQRTGEQWLLAWDNSARALPATAPGTQQRRWRARREIDARTERLRTWMQRNPGKEPSPRDTGASATGADPWGRAYVQRPCTDGFEVRSAGPDGALDTADDVAGAPVTVSSGFLQWLRAQQRREREHAASLQRLREAPAREAAAYARQRDLLRAERVEPAAASGQVAAALAAIDASSARLRAIAVHAAAMDYLRKEGAVPALADLQLAWLPEGGNDPWGAPLRIVEVRAGVLAVRSDGPDGKADTADDVVVTSSANGTGSP